MTNVNRYSLPLFLLSCLMAFIAGHIVNYSIIFLSLAWFDSHAMAGLGYGLCFGPTVILGWFAGVYCDRYSPRHVLLISQNSFFISLLLLYFALDAANQFQAPLLLLAALFSGIGWSFVAPARFSTLPFYVNRDKLAGAAIILNLMVMAGFGAAPIILKLIKVTYGWEQVLIIAAILFALSSLLLLPLSFQFKAKPAATALAEIRDSLTYVRDSDALKQLLVLSMIVFLLMGPMQVILPTISQQNLGIDETAQGYYLSLIAIGLIIGGVFAMVVKNISRAGVNIFIGVLVAGICLYFLAAATALSLSVIILCVAAASGGFAISFIVAGLQALSPDHYRGRIMSLYSMISQFIPALGGIIAGQLAQLYSPVFAMKMVALLIMVTVVMSALSFGTIRRLKRF